MYNTKMSRTREPAPFHITEFIEEVIRPRKMPGDRLAVQGYLAHEKTPSPLEPLWDRRHMPTVGS